MQARFAPQFAIARCDKLLTQKKPHRNTGDDDRHLIEIELKWQRWHWLMLWATRLKPHPVGAGQHFGDAVLGSVDQLLIFHESFDPCLVVAVEFDLERFDLGLSCHDHFRRKGRHSIFNFVGNLFAALVILTGLDEPALLPQPV